jgi:hypothetical protein
VEDSVEMLFTGSPLVRRKFGNQHCMKPFHVTLIKCVTWVFKGLLFYSRLYLIHIQFTKYGVLPLPFLEVRYYVNTKTAVIDNLC